MPRRLKHSSQVEKLFREIVDDLIQTHRFIANPVWAIMYEEEAFLAKRKRETKITRRAILRRLQKQNLIKTKKVGDKIMVTLCNHGQHERLRLLIAETRKKLPTGTYCLVSYDIPEKTRVIRLAFRNLLKFGRFKQLHRSVWICRFDVADIIQEFINQTNSKKWIVVFNSSKV